MPVGRSFVVGMPAFGVVAGFVVAQTPSLRALPVPAILWPVVVGLAADLALQALARQGRVEPLTMNERAAGIIGAGVTIALMVALLP